MRTAASFMCLDNDTGASEMNIGMFEAVDPMLKVSVSQTKIESLRVVKTMASFKITS